MVWIMSHKEVIYCQANIITEKQILKKFKQICIKRGLKIGRVLGDFVERYVIENSNSNGNVA
jgi:hypothetical protein